MNNEKPRIRIVICDNATNKVAGIHDYKLPAIGCAIHALLLVVKDSIMVQRSH